MNLLFLGTGTSHGVPVIGCDCSVCQSSDAKDKRNRCSAYITTNDNKNILIDIGPEFRIQALTYKIKNVDSVLLTHSHADHLHGIDDLRIFSSNFWHKPTNEKALEQYNRPPIPIYSNKKTCRDVEFRFDYIFKKVTQGGGVAKLSLNAVKQPFYIGQTKITPIPMLHGTLETCGWVLTEEDGHTKKSLAYLTDLSSISDESLTLIKNCGHLEHLVIDGLREKEHSTHFSFLQALACAEKLAPANVWLTHLTHLHSHAQTADYLRAHLSKFPGLANCQNVFPAYDGQRLEM